MRKAAILFSALGFFIHGAVAMAVDTQINITPPKQSIDPVVGVGVIFNNAIKLIFVVAVILVLVYLIIGAIQWILSGGDKDAVANARKRIINALIGLAILALSFLIITVVGNILGIGDILKFTLPSLTGK